MLDKKLSACKKSLISWSKDSKSNSRMKIHTLQSQLGTLEEQDYIDPALNHSLLSELDEARGEILGPKVKTARVERKRL